MRARDSRRACSAAGKRCADRVATYGEILDVDGVGDRSGLALAMDAPRTVTGGKRSSSCT